MSSPSCHGSHHQRMFRLSRSFWRTGLSIGLAVLFLLLLGRQQLLAYKLLHPQLQQLLPSPWCCTPAVLYNRRIFGGLLKYLEEDRSEEPVDLAISRYRHI